MLRKPYKTIVKDNGTVNIYGNNHWREIFYSVPEWALDKENADKEFEAEEEAAFAYKGNTHFLSEYMRIGNDAPDWMKEFDGYASDSFFSGTAIKINDAGDSVKVFTYIS